MTIFKAQAAGRYKSEDGRTTILRTRSAHMTFASSLMNWAIYHGDVTSPREYARTLYEAKEKADRLRNEWDRVAAGNVVRYVPTYVDSDGQRTMMNAFRGENTYETAEAAQAWLDAVLVPSTNPPSLIASVWGTNPQFEIRPVECYPTHFDPVHVYFD